jgi:hypothetical protein
MRVGGQLHAPAALSPGKRPSTHFIGGLVGPRAGLINIQDGIKMLITVKPQFYVPAFCVFCNFTHFLYGPSQMPIRTMCPGFYTVLGGPY